MPTVSRTRGIRIDVSGGRVLTSVNDKVVVPASSIIAKSTRKRVRILTADRASVVVAKNIGLAGVMPSVGGGLVDGVNLSLRSSGFGGSTTIVLKRGVTYAAAATVGTYSLSSGQTSSNITPSINYSAGESFFVDITASAPTPARGLTVELYYYGL